MEHSSLEEHIHFLEKRLLQHAVRTSVEQLDILLADDFLEFGRSGNTYTKKDVLDAACSSSAVVKRTLTDFKIKLLAADVILATYRIIVHNDGKHSLRSSIWKLNKGKWQMIFHQGTPTTIS